MPDIEGQAQKKYRILSLDGGGTWALIQVKTLIALYSSETKGHEVLKDFDLVAANSGGAIVAAALMVNKPLREILNLFQDQATLRCMFHKTSWLGGRLFSLSRWFAPFSTVQKRYGLAQVLGPEAQKNLNQFNMTGRNGNPVNFIISAYHYDRDRVRFFRSWSSRAGSFDSPVGGAPLMVSLVDAVHASSTAPVKYFDEPAKIAGAQYWDGGISGYNNPVLAAVVEGLAQGWPAAEIAALSIGTGNTSLPLLSQRAHGQSLALFKPVQKSGFEGDIAKLATAIVGDPPDSHTFLAHLMLGGGLPKNREQCPWLQSPIVRMNPMISPLGGGETPWRLPNGITESDFKTLVNMNLAAIQPREIALIDQFCEAWLNGQVANQPIRASADLACEIGDATFGDAKIRWQTIKP